MNKHNFALCTFDRKALSTAQEQYEKIMDKELTYTALWLHLTHLRVGSNFYNNFPVPPVTLIANIMNELFKHFSGFGIRFVFHCLAGKKASIEWFQQPFFVCEITLYSKHFRKCCQKLPDLLSLLNSLQAMLRCIICTSTSHSMCISITKKMMYSNNGIDVDPVLGESFLRGTLFSDVAYQTTSYLQVFQEILC